MKDYIKREDATSKQFRILIPNGATTMPVVYVWDIEHIPAADVVEVVRCKDCKHYAEVQDIHHYVCTYHVGCRYIRRPDDFCSRGEKVSTQINDSNALERKDDDL